MGRGTHCLNFPILALIICMSVEQHYVERYMTYIMSYTLGFIGDKFRISMTIFC